MQIVWLFIFGSVGGVLGERTRLPGGALLGAMVFAMAGNNMVARLEEMPVYYVFGLQALAGGLVGQEITGKMVKNIKTFVFPAAIISGFMLLTGLFLMFTVGAFFGWDLTTAWLGASPGRMQDMVILAGSLNLDGTKVLSVHLARTLVVLLFSGFYLKKMQKRDEETLVYRKKGRQ